MRNHVTPSHQPYHSSKACKQDLGLDSSLQPFPMRSWCWLGVALSTLAVLHRWWITSHFWAYCVHMTKVLQTSSWDVSPQMPGKMNRDVKHFRKCGEILERLHPIQWIITMNALEDVNKLSESGTGASLRLWNGGLTHFEPRKKQDFLQGRSCTDFVHGNLIGIALLATSQWSDKLAICHGRQYGHDQHLHDSWLWLNPGTSSFRPAFREARAPWASVTCHDLEKNAFAAFVSKGKGNN